MRDGNLELIDKMNYDALTRLCNPLLTELMSIVSGPGFISFLWIELLPVS